MTVKLIILFSLAFFLEVGGAPSWPSWATQVISMLMKRLNPSMKKIIFWLLFISKSSTFSFSYSYLRVLFFFFQTIPTCPKGTKYTVRTTWSGATYGICFEKPKKDSRKPEKATAGIIWQQSFEHISVLLRKCLFCQLVRGSDVRF